MRRLSGIQTNGNGFGVSESELRTRFDFDAPTSISQNSRGRPVAFTVTHAPSDFPSGEKRSQPFRNVRLANDASVNKRGAAPGGEASQSCSGESATLPCDRRNASVFPSGDTAAVDTFSSTTREAPPATPTAHSASRSPATDV